MEIRAKTDPGTTVLINGERAAVIFEGSSIRHFVGPLPKGIAQIAITAQNDSGGFSTAQVAVDVP